MQIAFLSVKKRWERVLAATGFFSLCLSLFIFVTGYNSLQEIIPSKDANEVAAIVRSAGDKQETFERIEIGAQSQIPNFGRCDRFYLVRKWKAHATDLLCVQFADNSPSRGAVVMSAPYVAADYGVIQDEPKIFIQAGFQKGVNERTGEDTETVRIDMLDHGSWAHKKYTIEGRWCDEDTLSEFSVVGVSPGIINIQVTTNCYSIETNSGQAIVLGTEQRTEADIKMISSGRKTIRIEIPIL